MKLDRQKSAVLELTLAGAFWGFGFIAATWALRGMGPLAITGWRFAIAAVVGCFASLFTREMRASQFNRKQFFLAMIPGFLLSATLVLQTWGLQYTTATKSAFITTLYVLLVPIFERFLLKRALPRYHIWFVLAALLGVVMICDLASVFFAPSAEESARLQPNFGDFLTLVCALAATAHILYFGVIAKRIGSAFAFNNFQSIWAGAIPLALSFVLEPMPHLSWDDRSLTGLLMLAFGSTLIAFALQVRAQKHIPPSLVSLLFLLESPFSALFAMAFLGEGLEPLQWLGGGLILLAAALSTVFTAEAPEVEDVA